MFRTKFSVISSRGLHLIPGLIEIITKEDSLYKIDPLNLHRIKVRGWKGHKYIEDFVKTTAGVGWMLAEEWEPFQEVTLLHHLCGICFWAFDILSCRSRCPKFNHWQ